MKEKIFLFSSIVIWIFFIILLVFYYQSYKDTTRMISDRSRETRNLVEKNVLDSLKYMNLSYKILGGFLNDEMQNISRKLVSKYKKDPNILSWDLKNIKSKYKNYEIYIIDHNLEVVSTTQKTDLGLDFNKYPNFARLLKKRMSGDAFVVDRMDISTKTKRLKKYSYMPTPDNKFLIELSVDIQNANPTAKELNVFEHAQELAVEHEEINNITYYKTSKSANKVGAVVTNETMSIDTAISKAVQDKVKKTLNSGKVQTYGGSEFEDIVSSKYIPYLIYNEKNVLDWWNSYIVRIDYNNDIFMNKISKAKNLFIFRISALLAVFLIFNIVMMYFLKKTNLLASLDPVTGLPNRALFSEQFHKYTKRRKYAINNNAAILFVDINDFKSINDKFGHDVGDVVLGKVAQTLQNNLRKNDIIVRAGGDEFYVLLEDVASVENAELVVQKLYDVFRDKFITNDYSIDLDISIGMCLYPRDGYHLKELIQKADNSMYRSKKARHE